MARRRSCFLPAEAAGAAGGRLGSSSLLADVLDGSTALGQVRGGTAVFPRAGHHRRGSRHGASLFAAGAVAAAACLACSRWRTARLVSTRLRGNRRSSRGPSAAWRQEPGRIPQCSRACGAQRHAIGFLQQRTLLFKAHRTRRRGRFGDNLPRRCQLCRGRRLERARPELLLWSEPRRPWPQSSPVPLRQREPPLRPALPVCPKRMQSLGTPVSAPLTLTFS